MTDTHTHPYLQQFNPDGGGSAALQRAREAGVSKFIVPNVDMDSIGPLRELCLSNPDAYPAIGLHPTEVDLGWENHLQLILDASKELTPVAIGEVGIDLYWDATHREEQKQAFALQIDMANRLDLPVIIHCRDGLDDTLEVIRSFGGQLPTLIFHSFTGSPADVKRIRREADAYFGINGVVTFKNAPELRESLHIIGIDRLLLETDSPYLAPVPHRGRRNESAYLPHVCDAIARELSLTPAEVEAATDRNALRAFPRINC